MELSIGVLDVNEAYEDLTEDVSILPEKLTIQIGHIQVSMEVFQNKIQSVKTEIGTRNGHSIIPFLQRGYLTDFTLSFNSENSSMTGLVDVLLWNPNIRNVTVYGYSLEQTIVEAITSARERIISAGGSCELRQAKIHFPMVCETFDISLEFQDGPTSPVVSSCEMWEDNSWLYREVFLKFGSSFTTLLTNKAFSDKFASVFDKITEKRGSNLKVLSLDTTNLTTAGIKCMERVVDRSRDLQKLTLVSKEMHKEVQQEVVEQLIRRFGKRLTGLGLFGDSVELWLPKVMSICPTRNELPELEELGMSSNLEGQLPLDCAQWIARMASGSCQLSSTFLCSSPIQSNIASTSSNKNPLRLLDLDGIPLQHDGWDVVFKALDLSAMKWLYIGSGFSMDDFRLLIDCISLNTNPVEKLDICFKSSSDGYADSMEWERRLRTRLPNVEVVHNHYRHWSAST
ncbi:hypothetical protein B0O80DRAFT_501202 [Mortierella sp. GBAus27b]|nr:hypothetical protein B0O80DRAFT_501202 [Mortierella sp. GBAus27b]